MEPARQEQQNTHRNPTDYSGCMYAPCTAHTKRELEHSTVRGLFDGCGGREISDSAKMLYSCISASSS